MIQKNNELQQKLNNLPKAGTIEFDINSMQADDLEALDLKY